MIPNVNGNHVMSALVGDCGGGGGGRGWVGNESSAILHS